jgi:peptide/nickel transport system substrate-binding protein
VLPKHAIDAERFDKSTLKPMTRQRSLTRLESVKPGDSLTFRRNPRLLG